MCICIYKYTCTYINMYVYMFYISEKRKKVLGQKNAGGRMFTCLTKKLHYNNIMYNIGLWLQMEIYILSLKII